MDVSERGRKEWARLANVMSTAVSCKTGSGVGMSEMQSFYYPLLAQCDGRLLCWGLD